MDLDSEGLNLCGCRSVEVKTALDDQSSRESGLYCLGEPLD
jgi:hypothetical protein